MKYIFIILTFLFTINLPSFGQKHENFTSQSLRIDFVLSGDAFNTQASIFEMKKEAFWGGSPINQDRFDYGEFKVIVSDTLEKEIYYSRGFCTLFEEWQTTTEAQSIQKSFFQTVNVPFPKEQIKFSILKRNEKNQFTELFKTQINPKDYGIIKYAKSKVSTQKYIDNGTPDECVDLVFIGDGYTENEINKYHDDVKRMTDHLFTQAPFNKYKDKFNIWIVDAISEDSGMTDPRRNIWKNTALKASFNTLDSDRYLESTHTFLIRDYAGLVPYDQIYIIANTKKYGGGGIYNHFSLTSVDHENSLPVFVHEFGHSFAGLGDEYFTSSTSYNDFYNLNNEPWQPNLTTRIAFDKKWADMVSEKTPIPTPAKEKYFNTVGVFEGGGYVAKGVYRPYYDCRMKSNEAEAFCPVCQKAITEMILFLIGE